MAEIRIEQKRRSFAWLWTLLVLLVLAAAAYWLYYQRGVRVSEARPAATRVATLRPATGLLAYVPTRRTRPRRAA